MNKQPSAILPSPTILQPPRINKNCLQPVEFSSHTRRKTCGCKTQPKQSSLSWAVVVTCQAMAIHDPPMLNVQWDPRLDWLQLYPHALRWQKFRGYAERVQCTPGASFLLWRSVKPVSHKEVFHRNEHRMGLLFGHQGTTSLNLHNFHHKRLLSIHFNPLVERWTCNVKLLNCMLPRLKRSISGLVLWSCGLSRHGIVSFLPQKLASGTEASSTIPLSHAAWWTG